MSTWDFSAEIALRVSNPLNAVRASSRLARSRKTKIERRAGFLLVAASEKPLPALPVLVRLTRVGPGRMDDEGVVASLKGVRDGVADALKVDDGDRARIRFEYEQETGRAYAVRVELRGVGSFT